MLKETSALYSTRRKITNRRPAVNHSQEIPEIEKAVSPLSQFIDFIAPMTNENSFKNGAEYAKLVIRELSDGSLPLDISDVTIGTFISDMQEEARTKSRSRHNTSDFDIENIIENKKGDVLLNAVVPRMSDKNAEYALRFQTFDDPIMRLGALTVLTLSEREAEREISESIPIELTPNIEAVLKYA